MKFIAYFDYLGFSDFIERNSIDYQVNIIENNFRDIENALSKGKVTDGKHKGVKVADLSESHIHCINFSDTVIFWTKDDSLESLSELLEVSSMYNWSCIDYFFPVRGSIVHGEIFDYKYDHKSNNGGTYGVNSVFGKGLVRAHAKAESQDWAGTVIEESILIFLDNCNIDVDSFLKQFSKKFLVPYKVSLNNQKKEWVLNLIKTNDPLPHEAFQNMKKNIIDNFSKHNKRTDSEPVQRKIQNTITFLESYL